MKILGIDTSTMTAGVGVIEDDQVLIDLKYDVKITYSEVLLSTIDLALKTIGLEMEKLDGFAISIGPGSFTGLRIGLSTVKGLCFASGKPLASVPSLDALASLSLFCRYPVVPLLDAKKNQVYAAIYDTSEGELKRKSGYLVVDIEELIKNISSKTLFVGPGIKVYQKDLNQFLGDKACIAPNEQSLPSGACVARIGLGKIISGQVEDITDLEPMYLRKSEAELKFRNVKRA
ncbi:MAG: tRNA (adenosine(37)-N6)-threonylcarbamoyltransferase complex dimerization subunit type 1 TsaB [Candidatus Zixiibacteriota bacterium]